MLSDIALENQHVHMQTVETRTNNRRVKQAWNSQKSLQIYNFPVYLWQELCHSTAQQFGKYMYVQKYLVCGSFQNLFFFSMAKEL